jgi:hypothetical protein
MLTMLTTTANILKMRMEYSSFPLLGILLQQNIKPWADAVKSECDEIRMQIPNAHIPSAA